MWTEKNDFLSTAIASIAAVGGQAVNVANFTSEKLVVPTDMATLIARFTTAGGDGGLVIFEFQISFDNGLTWTTTDFEIAEIKSDEDNDTGEVRHAWIFWAQGVSHIRLFRVTNNDAVTATTLVNASLAYGRK